MELEKFENLQSIASSTNDDDRLLVITLIEERLPWGTAEDKLTMDQYITIKLNYKLLDELPTKLLEPNNE